MSLRYRIYLSTAIILALSFIILGSVTVYQFKEENEEYHQQRLERKEKAVLAGLEFFVEQNKELFTSDSMFVPLNEIILELAQINSMDINLYNTKGQLLLSSYSEYFDKGIFVFQLEPHIINDLFQGEERVVVEEKTDSLDILSTYKLLKDSTNTPLAIINLPYFQNDDASEKEIKEYLYTLIPLYVLMFTASMILAYFISNYITKSLSIVEEKMKRTALGKKNEPIDWKGNDEIGSLISEYNRMILELEASAEKLTKSERESAWREMAKQVAHEIKNPLTPMKLSVQLLEKAWKDKAPDFSERLERFQKTMIEQIENLSAIAGEFSNFAHMPKAQFEVVELNHVIQAALDLFKENTDEVEIEFQSKCAEAFVLADKNQLLRVFNNLIKNSLQSISSGTKGIVVVELGRTNTHFEINVKDNGEGIDESMREKIFTPNFTTKSSGMGLGLSMVKEIIENHNGRITFETEKNKGTTFRIVLPEHHSKT